MDEISYKTIENDLEYLHQVSKEVDFNSDDWKEEVKRLKDFGIKDNRLLALASVQVGIPLRLIYLKRLDIDRLEEDYNEDIVMINPVITKARGLTRYWEACASCLEFAGLVERPYEIEVEYYDENKKKRKTKFTGFSATVVSHEMDHLDGILHMDVAIKVVEMPAEERKQLRLKEPYTVIKKKGVYKS